MNIDKEVKQLKKKYPALYKKYRGQFFKWYQERIVRFSKWRKSTLKQNKAWKKRIKKRVPLYKNKLVMFLESVIKRERLSEGQPEDLLNRQVYAKKIAEVIEKRHDKGTQRHRDERNIIFAVSGKWGSGKTRILELLEPLLIDKGFKVVWFNTWNYSQEPISLKRAFLKALAEDLESDLDLSGLEQDSTELKFSVKKLARFFSFLIPLFLFATALLFIKETVFASSLTSYFMAYIGYIGKAIDILISSEVVQLLIIPVAIFLLTEVFTLKQTASKISTAEEFRSKFEELVKDEAKVVIFVDDLDRCTPEVVKQILDALVTFFKNDNCSFVVTGDHTVIEQYVGTQLKIAPIYTDGNKDERKTRVQEVSEGRRFLKKLFDVYWQIPAPEPARFKKYVEKEIKKLDIKNLDESKQEQLIGLLAGFLEPNPRAVVRFLTALSFNLDTLAYMIEEKKKETDSKTDASKELADIELKGLEEVVQEPTLLAKVLLIQELFYPLYEELVQQPDVLPLHEKEVRKRGDITTQLKGKDIKDILVQDEDLGSYKELLRTPPNFTDENDAVIFNADKFLYLSGFTGLPSQKGPDEEWFLKTLKTAIEAKDLIAKLKGASDRRQKQLLTLSQKSLAGSSEPTEKQEIARNMAEIILSVDVWSGGFDTLVTKLVEANFIHELEQPVRAKLASLIFQFAFEKDANVANFFATTPWNDPVYAPVRWEAASQSKTLSLTAVTNLASDIDGDFDTNESQAITHLKVLAEKSNQEEQEVQTQLKPLFDELVAVIFTKPADQTRLQVLKVLKEADKKKLSKETLIQKQTEVMQGASYQSEIQFLLSNQQQFQSSFENSELKDLRKVGIDFLKSRSSVDWSPLADVLLAHQPWEEPEKNLILDALFHHFRSADAGMFNYALEYLKKPETRKFAQAITILNRLSQALTTVEEERKETILDFMNKGNWPEVAEAELGKENQNILTSLAKGRSSLSKKAKDALKSWGISQKRAKKRVKRKNK